LLDTDSKGFTARGDRYSSLSSKMPPVNFLKRFACREPFEDGGACFRMGSCYGERGRFFILPKKLLGWLVELRAENV
jgi:hypothetical protein